MDDRFYKTRYNSASINTTGKVFRMNLFQEIGFRINLLFSPRICWIVCHTRSSWYHEYPRIQIPWLELPCPQTPLAPPFGMSPELTLLLKIISTTLNHRQIEIEFTWHSRSGPIIKCLRMLRIYANVENRRECLIMD